jgi:hypothetical protein
VTLYHLGDLETARQHTLHGLQIWRSGTVSSPVEEVDAPIVTCASFQAIIEWHTGEIASYRATMNEAISLAEKLNDRHALAVAIFWSAVLGYYERNPAEVERRASDLVELATRQRFRYWRACGAILRGWACSASGEGDRGLMQRHEPAGTRRLRILRGRYPGALLGLAAGDALGTTLEFKSPRHV